MLKRWRPKKDEWDDGLPAPDWEFTEMETAKAFHTNWTVWKTLPVHDRARMVAHEIEASKREWYRFEVRQEKKKDGGEGGDNEEYMSMRRRFGW